MAGPVWLAVDTADLGEARTLVRECAPWLGGVKLGLEFFVAHGPDGVAAVMAQSGLPCFLDLKLHDIPNTVEKAASATVPLAPSLLTVHAGGGGAMVAAARRGAGPATRIIAVTVLTSLDDADLAALGVADSAATHVARLALVARHAGADGMVCSSHEVASVRRSWSNGVHVVPGVRPAGADAGDQKRVMTPAQAMAAGASLIVVGRPITAASDPAEAARRIADELAAASVA